MSRLGAFLPRIAVFLGSVVVSGSIAYIALGATSAPEPVATAGERPEFEMTAAGAQEQDVPVSFDLIRTAGDPAVIEALATEELATVTTATLDGGPPAWLNPSGFPRVSPITQFDGSPHQNANCGLAAGAMLARLGYGIVTTGSILRTLQDDQVGGTGLDDLQVALWRGYGVTVSTGALLPSQLKALLAAGYGAVIQGTYGEIPPALRLQVGYTGAHAIYVDGYYPGSATIPEAYYVIDPLGRPAYGYEGEWWPASVVDAFGTSFGGGRIRSAWVFPPGGVPPEVIGPDVVAIPPSGGDVPDASALPSVPASPPSSGDPSVEPGEPGDTDPGLSPVIPPLDPVITLGGLDVQVWLELCLILPFPAGCPDGIPGVFEVDVGDLAIVPGPEVDVLFVDSDRPNVAQIGFTVEGGGPSEVRYWHADGTPPTVFDAGSIASLELFGQTIHVATLDVLASTTYHFQVVAGGAGGVGLSPIGTFTTAGGVLAFDLALATIESPVIDLVGGLSPYLHLGAGLAPPAAGEACPVAEVDFALDGIDAEGVVIRAFPVPPGDPGPGGSLDALGASLEKEVLGTDGSAEIGCLEPGTAYHVVVDAIGDAGGPLAVETIEAP